MITVTASDGEASVSDEFMVTIMNTAPTVVTRLTAVAIERGMGFEAIDLSTTFSDANGDVLSYTVTSSDENIVSGGISSTTLTLMEVGVGTAMITVTASDGEASISDEFMVTITVKEPTLGIADTDILAVYPNPSSGIFQFSRTADRVQVYDMSGRLVYQGKKIKQLDLTSKPIGQYLVEMHIGNERGRYTIIKK